MENNKQYYAGELAKIDLKSSFNARIKIFDPEKEENNTKFINLNQYSAEVLIKWLKDNFIPKHPRKNQPKLRTLLNRYDFNNVRQYYDMIIESFINGQRAQAIEQFKSLPKPEKINLIANPDIYGLSDEYKNVLIIEVLNK